MARTTVSSDSIAKPVSRATSSLVILRRRRLLQLHDFSPRLTGFIGRTTSVLALILIITILVHPDLVRGVNASSAMLPEQRPQPAMAEVPLPAAPQARIFHLHPRNAASVEATPTLTMPLTLLLFFYLVIMA